MNSHMSVDLWIDDDDQPAIETRHRVLPSHESWAVKILGSADLALDGLTVYLRRRHLAAMIDGLRSAADELEASMLDEAVAS